MNILTDLITKNPEVYEFHLKILKAQVKNPSRFLPIPKWLEISDKKDKRENEVKIEEQQPDMEVFKKILTFIDKPIEKIDDKYTLDMLHFLIVSCPLNLSHINKTSDIGQFKVTWPESIEAAFEEKSQKLEYLYHGSALNNWYCILRHGLKVTSGTKWMTAGAAYGNGIYLSDTLNVSYNYSMGTHSIIVGVYEIYDAAKYRKAVGYYVVPDEKLLLLRYLIYVPNITKTNLLALDEQLKSEWATKSTNKATAVAAKHKKIDARIKKEIEKLETMMNATVIRTSPTQITINPGNYTVDFPFLFPFSAPVVTPTVAGIAELWTPKSSLVDFLH